MILVHCPDLDQPVTSAPRHTWITTRPDASPLIGWKCVCAPGVVHQLPFDAYPPAVGQQVLLQLRGWGVRRIDIAHEGELADPARRQLLPALTEALVETALDELYRHRVVDVLDLLPNYLEPAVRQALAAAQQLRTQQETAIERVQRSMARLRRQG